MLLNYEFLILGWIFLAICSLLVMIQTVKKYKLLLVIFIPVLLFLTTTTYLSVNGLLGYPTIQSIPEKFLIKSHIVDEENDKVYLWLINFKEQQLRPRAYTVPYSIKLVKQLEQTKDKREKGIPVIGEFQKLQNKSTDFSKAEKYKIYVFPHQELMKKDD